MIKLLIVWIRPRAHDICEVLLRAPFGEQARTELDTAAGYGSDFNLRKFLLEVWKNRLITADVNDNLPFLLCRLDRPFPFLLPGMLRLRGNCLGEAQKNENYGDSSGFNEAWPSVQPGDDREWKIENRHPLSSIFDPRRHLILPRGLERFIHHIEDRLHLLPLRAAGV